MAHVPESLTALFASADAALKGPERFSVGLLKEPLDGLRAGDLGLEDLMRRLPREQEWQTWDLYHSDRLHAGVFMLPAGHRIPLHDHPQMTVLFRVLWGRLRLRAYDWAREYPMEGLARGRGEQSLDGASPTQVLGPQWHNLHAIEAESDCAFLDVFAPYYCSESGRVCSYYREGPWIERDGQRLRRIEAVSASA